MAKIAVDAYLNLAELFNDNFNAVLLLAGDGMPGSEMVMTMQGDHDQNTRNWVAFLLKNPDYISIVFRSPHDWMLRHRRKCLSVLYSLKIIRIIS